MSLLVVGILIIVALVIGGAIVAFAGWVGFIVAPILIALIVYAAVRGASRAGEIAAQGGVEDYDERGPNPGAMGSGGGVQG